MRPDPERSPSTVDTAALLRRTAEIAAGFLATLDERPVRASAPRSELLAGLGGPLPEAGEAPAAVLEHLAREAEPGVVGMALTASQRGTSGDPGCSTAIGRTYPSLTPTRSCRGACW